jgi:hypothetical protein
LLNHSSALWAQGRKTAIRFQFSPDAMSKAPAPPLSPGLFLLLGTPREPEGALDVAWRVEYFDNDGGCYVTIFAGPEPERRARDYFRAMKAGPLKIIARVRRRIERWGL